MKNEFKNFIKNIKDIKLSETEKAILHSKISEFISFNPIRDKAHVPGTKNYLSIFEVKYFVRATALILIIGIVTGVSGVSYAASDALPGEKLYNVKVNINEKIEESLAFTTEAKVVVESKQVERRLEETQTLVKENKLSENAKKIVEKKLDEHIESLTKDISTLKEDGKVEVVLETTAKLTPVLEVHKEILEDKQEDTESLIAKVEDSIQKVEKEEIEVLASAIKEDVTEENINVDLFSTSMTQTSPENISESNYTATESASQEIQNKKEFVEETIEQVVDLDNENIAKFIELRIQKTEEKIQLLKKTYFAESNEIKDATETKDETILNKTEEKPTKDSVSIDLTDTKALKNISDIKIEKAPVDEILDTQITDKNTKILKSEEYIKNAKQAFLEKNYKDSLSLTQEALKLLGEIEVEDKLKSMELTLNTQASGVESNTQPAQVIEYSK